MHSHKNVGTVLRRLQWMHEQRIWPNGLRYLWTDAHGVCLYVSLYKETNDMTWINKAEELVRDVDRVLGREKGYRIGEEPDRDGQYYHYLTKWMYSLNELGKVKPQYHTKAVQIAKDIHPHFCVPGRGVIWKMTEDLTIPYPGYGLGGLDFYDGYAVYRMLDEKSLSSQIADMHELVQKYAPTFSCEQDLGLGECLWFSHFFPNEAWAKTLRSRSLSTLDTMWINVNDTQGYFCRHPDARNIKFGFTNFGVSYALQAAGVWPERVEKLHNFFESYRSHDEYDTKSITHVMHCNALLPGVLLATGEKSQQQQQQQQDNAERS